MDPPLDRSFDMFCLISSDKEFSDDVHVHKYVYARHIDSPILSNCKAYIWCHSYPDFCAFIQKYAWFLCVNHVHNIISHRFINLHVNTTQHFGSHGYFSIFYYSWIPRPYLCGQTFFKKLYIQVNHFCVDCDNWWITSKGVKISCQEIYSH